MLSEICTKPDMEGHISYDIDGLYKMPRIDKSIGTESRLVVA